MKYIENIQQVAELNPDYLGFIFYEKSPRNFEGIIPQLPKGIQKVGVFVNEYMEIVVSMMEEYKLDVVQLHGDESVAYIKELKTHVPKLEIVKVFGIKDTFNFTILESYEEVVDYFLFDTKGKERGGNGVTFNWEVLKEYPSKKPFFLSGGIGLEELEKVKDVLKTKLPIHALDVNSKFETKAGLKSVGELKKFKRVIEENK
ncbi:N-(5'-phosphoribosyl)anthranilate isomerase [Tenacibaculum holothuriorum]|uniref:N-(5'-phosphoribosyl)anthranilate isomerase n=1 Tax=Tenacibaculum holothuriorum TaxID=1635173 RepID=A0A1Y2PBY5_9FLAO|nr:phosphoribosylanthranilate isomerase [Tenacibaculum holothuriorum]OSY87297.1 N-(5'-phosphoribosyl)anthranilate isomerase [Tenacibaculum holothuriorum]